MSFSACYLSCRNLSGGDSFYWCILANVCPRTTCTGVAGRGRGVLVSPLPALAPFLAAARPPPPPAARRSRRRPPPPRSGWRRGLRGLPGLESLPSQLSPADGRLPRRRDPHCARNGSRGSISAGGGGGGSPCRRGRFCSRLLNALSLLFTRTEQ